MRLLLVLLLYALGAGLALRGMVFASSLFLWSDIFQPLEFAKSPGRFPVAQFVTAVLLGSYLWHWGTGRLRPRFGPFFFLLCAMLAWIGVTAAVSAFPLIARDEFVLYLKYLLPIAAIHTAIGSRRDIRVLAAVLAGSVAVWGSQAGVYCLIHGARTDLGIPGGQMVERNDFAAAVVGTIPILMYFMLTYKGRFKAAVRAGTGLCIFLCLSAVILSLSRGASLGLAAQVLLYIGYVSRRKLRDLTLVAVAGAVVVLFLPQSWYDRMGTIQVGEEQTESSAASRMKLMKGAFQASLDRPVFGLGPGGWLEVADAYAGTHHNPHSIYMVLSSETGFPGLALYMVMIIFTYVQVSRTIGKAARRGDTEMARLGAALITSIFGLLSAMTFLNRPFNEYLWAWLALANALPWVYAKELSARGAGRRGAGAAPGAAAAGGITGPQAGSSGIPSA